MDCFVGIMTGAAPTSRRQRSLNANDGQCEKGAVEVQQVTHGRLLDPYAVLTLSREGQLSAFLGLPYLPVLQGKARPALLIINPHHRALDRVSCRNARRVPRGSSSASAAEGRFTGVLGVHLVD